MELKAVQRINLEMKENGNNPFVHVVGNYILEHLKHHPEDSEKVLMDGRTLKGAFDVTKNEAKKKAVNNMAMIADTEVFNIVKDYYKLSGSTATMESPEEPKVTASKNFDVSIEDLL